MAKPHLELEVKIRLNPYSAKAYMTRQDHLVIDINGYRIEKPLTEWHEIAKDWDLTLADKHMCSGSAVE